MDPKRRKAQNFAADGLNDDGMELSPAADEDEDKQHDFFRSREKARALNRKKDIVCLILSYPPLNSENRERHKGWILDVLEVNHKLRQLEAPSKGSVRNVFALHWKAPFKEKEMDISRLDNEITGLMNHSVHDIEDYVPPYIIEEMDKGTMRFPDREKVQNLAVDYTLRQILQAIEISEFQRIEITQNIAISGVASLMSALKNLPSIRKMFNTVIHVEGSHTFYPTSEAIEHSIITELGFSASTRAEVDELLKSKNFLILVEDVPSYMDMYELGTNWWNTKNTQKIVWSTRFYAGCNFAADLTIRLKDHLFLWKFFCINAGAYCLPSHIRRLADRVLKESCGHLLAIALIAKSLKGVNNVHVWEYASHTLGLWPTSRIEDRILFNALRFIWGRLDSAACECIKYCALNLQKEGTFRVELIRRWIKDTLIGTLDEGEKILQNLVNMYLLESFRNGDLVRMRDEIRTEFVNLFRTDVNTVLHRLDGRGLREAPKDEAWEKANEMHLMNNKISKLPGFPNCPELINLFLQANSYLRVIPPLFFQYMPALQVLDLSQTRIRTLPPSLFKLVQLRKFFLRGCELFMELPPEIGELHYLEVLDLEGTEIKNLPAALGNLANLRCLRLSFYGFNNNRKKNPSDRIIPKNVMSSLLHLERVKHRCES